MRTWLKANGGPPALIIVGLGFVFLFWPLGAGFLAVGSAMWLYSWKGYPFTISRRATVALPPPDTRRLELLRQAHAVLTELETARYQLEEAKEKRRGWHATDALPTAKFAEWRADQATATQGGVFAALRGTYIWMERMNVAMAKRERTETNAVGTVTRFVTGLGLHTYDIKHIDEGLSRIQNAKEHLDRLVTRYSEG